MTITPIDIVFMAIVALLMLAMFVIASVSIYGFCGVDMSLQPWPNQRLVDGEVRKLLQREFGESCIAKLPRKEERL